MLEESYAPFGLSLKQGLQGKSLCITKASCGLTSFYLTYSFNLINSAGAVLLVRQRCCRRAVYLKACTDLPTTTPWFLLAVLTSSFLKQQDKRSSKHL